MTFSYEEMTLRNIGFVTESEQKILRLSTIFIPGVGGMGGTALEVLARSGVGHFIIADLDVFEVSNLNRQIFSTLDKMGLSKAQVARDRLLQINPELQIEVMGIEWVEKMDSILARVDLIINGCDDHSATIQLMRKAKQFQKTVIDAFASPLPSVYVVKPTDPRPEQMFGFATVGLEVKEWKTSTLENCIAQEIEYVLTHSNSHRHVVLENAAEMITGKRKRFSLATMVWMTGILMSYEATKILLSRPTTVTYRGVFFNPWTTEVERPLSWPFAWIKGFFVRRFLAQLAR